ncbi:hypothetical protein L3X37_01765 [Sabulilitoribacter arenilitoris]|uniref:Uncharacterized protein n=1 Tax=Wocania arenilitoris TaxID=2044858 RepID=A0AAE3EMC8_9FLAO|nr:hypothetical protein [Wocania arenilitoris]MCF7567092.1 hypothetical protein [Wocania arenilitoris]
MIAFLHTSNIHIDKFEKLVRKFNSDIEIKHFVNADILSYALKKGKTDSKSFQEEVFKIKKEQPDLIICTCSTYGEECDKTKDIERIDEPIAKFLVSNFTKIGLAYTANSTKKVSKNLILKMAKNNNKSIQIVNCDCSSSWKYYENNDLKNYAKSIAKKIESIESDVEVIFLAQASMEGSKDYLKKFRKKYILVQSLE